jgi:hypothetical protein
MLDVLTVKLPEVFVDGGLFCDAMMSCRLLPTFRRNCHLHLQGKSDSFIQEKGVCWDWVGKEKVKGEREGGGG